MFPSIPARQQKEITMINPKVLFAASAMTLALLPFSVRAEDAPKPPSSTMQCMAGKEMQCGMAGHMADMEQRMARMREGMDQCAKGEKQCDKSEMMSGMKDMHDRMGEMMKQIGTMSGDQKPNKPAAKPKQSNDHSEHHPDAPK
jgi:hypothetical protein